MSDCIVAIDQGTTGTTVLVLDTEANVLGRGYKEITQYYPQPGWVEHDPEEIWQSVITAANAAMQAAMIPKSRVKAIGITNQRETVVVWDRATAKPCRNAIVWQCRRTAPLTEKLREMGHEALFTRRTGLLLDPYFSGTKLNWFLENTPGMRQDAEAGRLAAGTIDSWLIYRLTGGKSHATDVTNASRTLLMDLASHKWDAELCGILDVPMKMLPEILSCDARFGETQGVSCFPDGVPVAGVAGDQQAALFGQACFSPGEAKCTFGTGAFMLLNTGEKPVASTHRLLTTVAWKRGDKAYYALEGSAFIAGALVQWLRDGLGLIKKAKEIEALARSVPDSGGVVLVPALAGLSAPYWRADARGLICGISRATTKEHLARAALEGIALQNAEILTAMEADAGFKLKALKVDGGASSNNLLMQLQSDYLGCRIVRPKMLETTALGAAFLAGLGSGLYRDTGDIEQAWKTDRVFDPEMDEAGRGKILARWREAVSKA
ncbi:MAG: glycerol kinase GlpK [Deltaproteobacteria bacterium]|nr:glycerol kinase GlpK [Deltaproteobacteria bacterium]